MTLTEAYRAALEAAAKRADPFPLFCENDGSVPSDIEKQAHDIRFTIAAAIRALPVPQYHTAEEDYPFSDASLFSGSVIGEPDMVMVPKDPTAEMLEAGKKAWKTPRLHVSYNPADELNTCGVIYRAMIERKP